MDDEQAASRSNGQSADRQTSIPGTAPARTAPPPDGGAPKRKRGRPPKDRSAPPQDGVTAKRAALRKLLEEADNLKLQIAADEKNLEARQVELIGKAVIKQMGKNPAFSGVVQNLLAGMPLSAADRAALAPLLQGGKTP